MVPHDPNEVIARVQRGDSVDEEKSVRGREHKESAAVSVSERQAGSKHFCCRAKTLATSGPIEW
jgi:hypothetical protein